MIKLYNLDKWSLLTGGQQLAFMNDRPRNVRLEVNAPHKTHLWYIDTASGEVHFLAWVEGRESIEFGSLGAFSIGCDEGDEVLIYTADGTDVSVEALDPVSMTTIVERRPRNPDLEYIAAQMTANMEARLAATTRELERRYEAREAARPPVGEAPRLSGSAGAESGQAVNAQPSNPSATEAGGGSGIGPTPAGAAAPGELRDSPTLVD